ncbi:MAG: type II toxin-antitoxin system HicB family antitoxin [Gemmataceae bacterium]|nr:type II toxin-antitoxin system HicB family antitoxin [Gemmataceae bacterium]
MAKKPTRYTVTDGKLVLTLEAAEEGGYVVTAPFIPGLVTEAETVEEAFEMARDAAAVLRAANRKGRKAATAGRR